MTQELAKEVDLRFKTGAREEIVNFEWEILDFNNIIQNEGALATQKICIVTPDGYKWHLRITEGFESKDSADPTIQIRCTLEKHAKKGPGTESEVAYWNFEAVAQSHGGNIMFLTNSNSNCYSEGRKVYPMEFIPGQETLVASEDLYNISCQVNGNLILKGNLTVFKRTEQNTPSLRYLCRGLEKASFERLARDIGDLLSAVSKNGNDNSDVEFHTEDGVIIPAHRTILSARSDYFKTMFESGMLEQTTGKITVEGINGKAMKTLVQFLYSGTLNEDWYEPDVIYDFTKAAHFYQVEEVVEFLDRNVGKVCDLQEAGNLLILCKRLEMKGAEKELRQLIKNSLMQTEKEDEFDDLLVSMAKSLKTIN